MTNAAERQKHRRERLRAEGRAEVVVTVRREQTARLRALAVQLDRGVAVSLRLIPALQVLRGIADDLATAGVARAGVFGSTARGEDGPESDVDVLLCLKPEADPDPIDLMKISDGVRDAFKQQMPEVAVDVAIRDDMREHVRTRADTEAVYAY